MIFGRISIAEFKFLCWGNQIRILLFYMSLLSLDHIFQQKYLVRIEQSKKEIKGNIYI
jgi:hypothetical protein